MVKGSMEAAVYQSKDRINLEEISISTIQEGEALIKVEYVGICGTDLTIISGKHPRVKPPMVLGHEFSGRVAQVESRKTTDIKIDDRVVVMPLLSCGECELCRDGLEHLCENFGLIGMDVNGAFAEYVKVPLSRVYRLPDDIPFDVASIIESLAVAVHAVRWSELKIGDVVVILGGGPIGVLVATVALAGGASQVIISERSDFRLELAKKYGIQTIDIKKTDPIEEVKKLTKGKGAEIVFEAVGIPATVERIASIVRTRGQIILLGLQKGLPPVDLVSLVLKEIQMKGSKIYSKLDFMHAIGLVANNRIDLKSLITHRLELSKIMQGFKIMKNPDISMKVLIKP